MLNSIRQVFLLMTLSQIYTYGIETSPPQEDVASKRVLIEGLGVSTNPSTVNIFPGTGEFGKFLLKSTDKTPLRIGGVWVADGNAILTGGADLGKWSGNNLAVVGLDLDLNKLMNWEGGSLGVAFLQFNGMNSNERAGSVQGFDSMSVLPPFNRTELYEIWFRQTFLENKLAVRIGKTIPTYDFNNILSPVPVREKAKSIPSVSGLLYTPIFINPVNIGVMPGYYNSAYGVTVNIAPINNYYISLGAYDGNLAKGVQTGLTGPHLNGYYFYAAETGVNWMAGSQGKPGNIAIGGWAQTGKLSIPNVVEQKGAQGLYLFGAQRLWFHRPEKDDSGISAFWQLGINHAKTLPMNKFVGFGMTAFALTRPKDSFGMGAAWSWLNR
ncbi:MAG: carbohydrate porin, partial [Verrucomicrobia bacterium]|nr:carbohydrate porin [Verrucomicrobiota bacterium]